MSRSTSHARARLADVVASAGLVVTWSSGFIGAHLGTRHAPADTLLVWRYLTAAVLLVALLLATRRRLPGRGGIVRHGLVGVLCQGCYLGGIVTGVGLGVPTGTAALIAALQPLVVAEVAGLALQDRPTGRQRAGLALGLLGVALVVAGDLHAAPVDGWVYLLPLGGMLALSLGTVLERHWDLRDGLPESLTVQTLAVAAVLVLEAGLAGHLAPPPLAGFWWAVGWVVGLSTFGGYGLYFLVLRRSGPTQVSTLLYLTPPCTLLWGAAMLGERPGPLAYPGMAVCAAAVLIVLGSAPATRAPAVSRRLPVGLLAGSQGCEDRDGDSGQGITKDHSVVRDPAIRPTRTRPQDRHGRPRSTRAPRRTAVPSPTRGPHQNGTPPSR